VDSRNGSRPSLAARHSDRNEPFDGRTSIPENVFCPSKGCHIGVRPSKGFSLALSGGAAWRADTQKIVRLDGDRIAGDERRRSVGTTTVRLSTGPAYVGLGSHAKALQRGCDMRTHNRISSSRSSALPPPLSVSDFSSRRTPSEIKRVVVPARNRKAMRSQQAGAVALETATTENGFQQFEASSCRKQHPTDEGSWKARPLGGSRAWPVY
jgi:hypothetical protein